MLPNFNLNYLAYGIKEIRTSVKAPNMNAIAERFIGSVRREALDYFLQVWLLLLVLLSSLVSS